MFEKTVEKMDKMIVDLSILIKKLEMIEELERKKGTSRQRDDHWKY